MINMKEKQIIQNLRKFCRSFGKYSDWFGDKRKAPSKVKLYLLRKEYHPQIGTISILDPYLQEGEVLEKFRRKFPELRFRPDFFAGLRRIEVEFKEVYE